MCPRLQRCRKACCLCAFEAADSHAQSLSEHLYLLARASQRTFALCLCARRVLSSTLALTCWRTPGLLPHCALHNTRRLARLCGCATDSVRHKFRASTAQCLLVQHRQACPQSTVVALYKSFSRIDHAFLVQLHINLQQISEFTTHRQFRLISLWPPDEQIYNYNRHCGSTHINYFSLIIK